MKDDEKTKDQLISELTEMHNRINEFESSEGEQRQGENLGSEAEWNFKHLAEQLSELVYRADLSTLATTYVNSSVDKIYGYTAEEWLSAPELWEKTILPEDKEMVLRKISEAHEKLTAISLEYRIKRKDGEIRWVQDNISWEKDHMGNDISMLGVMYDITKRKRDEEALRERDKRLTSIYEHVNEIIFYLDVEAKDAYRFQSVNPAFLIATGLNASQVVGKLIQEVIPEPSLSLVMSNYRKAIQNREPVRWEEVTTFPSGTKVGDVSVSPLFDDKGICTNLIGTVYDITERRQAEEEQERLNVELIDKNKELEQLLYVTSHDLRSPLINIDGYSKELDYSLKECMSFLENETDISKIKDRIGSLAKEDIPESLHYIKTSVDKMESLIKGILKLSRIGTSEGNIEEIDINEMIRDIVDTHQFRLDQSGIKTEISELPNCKGDSVQVNQVFSNLIDNAIKYSDSERTSFIYISGHQDKNLSIYCVEDNGIGIASEYKEKIFEIFHQLEPQKVMGEGMGLTVANRIIEKHNGKIWVESELGKGSKFFVSLPS